MNLPKSSLFLLFYVIIDDCDDKSFKDNEKIIQYRQNIVRKGENSSNDCTFFDINQKITNKTRIFMHFVPRNR